MIDTRKIASVRNKKIIKTKKDISICQMPFLFILKKLQNKLQFLTSFEKWACLI